MFWKENNRFLKYKPVWITAATKPPQNDVHFSVAILKYYKPSGDKWLPPSNVVYQRPYPDRHLLVQSQQLKHQNNVWNLFKVNNKDNNRHWRPSVVNANFEQISLIVLVFLLLILNN